MYLFISLGLEYRIQDWNLLVRNFQEYFQLISFRYHFDDSHYFLHFNFFAVFKMPYFRMLYSECLLLFWETLVPRMVKENFKVDFHFL